MATINLPRTATRTINYSNGSVSVGGANQAVYCSAKFKQLAQWVYNLSALQTERAGRDIIITRATARWYTSAMYTYDIRIQAEPVNYRSAGVYLGEAKGTSKTEMRQISTSRAAPHESIHLIQSIINGGADAIYLSCQNESTAATGYGTCQYGELILEYEYAAPRTVIDYIVADKERILLGDTIGFTASVRNTTDAAIDGVQFAIVREVDGADVQVGDTLTVDASIAPGATAIFQQEIAVPAWADPVRSTQLYLRVTIAGAASEKAKLCLALDKLYNPQIEAFRVQRALQHPIDGWMVNDNGMHTMTDLKISLGAGATGFTLTVYYGTGNVDTATADSIALTSKLSAALTGITGATGIVDTADGFGLDNGWNFLLVLTDGYETAQMSAAIDKAFTNLHLAGFSTGGVRIGGYCRRSAQGDPAFECSYPAYFDAGIATEQYHDGDVITLEGGAFYGYATNGAEYIRFTIPLRKSLEKINSATITTLMANIANSGGYGITSGFVAGGSNYLAAGITCTCTILKETNEIMVSLDRASAFALANNDTLSVRNEKIVVVLNE